MNGIYVYDAERLKVECKTSTQFWREQERRSFPEGLDISQIQQESENRGIVFLQVTMAADTELFSQS